jgi:hypothetical protein
MSILDPIETRGQTPTQFDLARWMFEYIAAIEGEPKTRIECLELMTEIMAVVRPPAKNLPRKRDISPESSDPDI